jgi:hypothetical protein
MKSIMIAAGLLVAGVTAASAQYASPPWARGDHPYAQRHHATCQDKAHRLHQYERRSARDGHIDRRERMTIEALRRDLDRTCGRYRHRG